MITEINEHDDAQVLVEENTTIVTNEATVVVEENERVEPVKHQVPTKPAVKTFNDFSQIDVMFKDVEPAQPQQTTETTVSDDEIPSEEKPTVEVEVPVADEGIKEEDTATQEVDNEVTTTDSDTDSIEEDVDSCDEVIEEDIIEQVSDDVSTTSDEEEETTPETVFLVDLSGNHVEVLVTELEQFYTNQANEAKRRQQVRESLTKVTEVPKQEPKVEEVKESKPVVKEQSQPDVQKDTTLESVSKVSDNTFRPMYDRDPELEHIMLMTVKSIKRCLNHTTHVVATTKNNKHFTLKVESNAIQNLFLHGISKAGFRTKEELIQALQDILNHWNENLGVLPDNQFTVCYMRLQIGDRMLNAKVSKNSLLRDEEVRNKIYSHYMSPRWEWSYRSIVSMLELADSCESKTRFVDGEVKTRICVKGQWTPFLEDMEAYFGVKDDPYADVNIPEEERLRYVGITLRVLGTNNPRAVGHIVKMNAIRKALLVERAETIKSEKIEIHTEPRYIKTTEVDASSLQNTLNSDNTPKKF